MKVSKKITLLGLAALSTAAIALPSPAMAEDIPLHLVPKPEKPSALGGGSTVIEFGIATFVCEKIEGSAKWESGTTGTIDLSIIGCKLPFGGVCQPAEAKGLPFHLLTLPSKSPGILITPPASGVFFKLVCPSVALEVKGSGLVGTLTAPQCGGESSSATIRFERTLEAGVQKHTKVEGTETDYRMTLVPGGSPVSLESQTTLLFEGKKKLECT